jgi:hypothetical protein
VKLNLLMTPTASNTPGPSNVNRADVSPLSCSGTPGPLKDTVTTMAIMLNQKRFRHLERYGATYAHLTRANADALESFSMFRYNDRGYEKARVKKMMTKRLETRKEKKPA